MRSTRALPALLSVGLLSTLCQLGVSPQASADVPPEAVALRVDGQVLHQEKPVEAARVYVYEVATFALRNVVTDAAGRFFFADLPAGLYKVVAYKPGFVPAIRLLMRRTADSAQRLDLRLVAQAPAEGRDGDGDDYWEARSRVPQDVLRDIERFEVLAAHADARQLGLTLPDAFEARMLANRGVEQLGGGLGTADSTGAQLGLQGALGSLPLGLEGRFEQLVPRAAEATPLGSGEVASLALHVGGGKLGRLTLSGANAQLMGLPRDAGSAVDLERYQVQWSGPTGPRARTSVSARFTEQSNFYTAGWIDPDDVPASSSTWDVEGSYSRDLGPASTLRAGLRYRQTSGAQALDEALSLFDEAVGVFGLAESRLHSRVLVEYGLFSTVREGGVSLMPHGGVVIELPRDWKARAAFSQRVEESEADPLLHSFTSALFRDGRTCQEVGGACYELSISHGRGDDELRFGAVHREIAETLRLYFSEDFFDRLESLFFVRGDEVPEMQVRIVRRVSPKVLAKLESSYGAGGGGIFYSSDDAAYENHVRYLVTSLDTRLERTSTGIFVAFHHLEQQLSPAEERRSAASDPALVELQRLQLMLTQDLGMLLDVTSRWAVRLAMELSRGATPYSLTDDETHRKLTGGFTVSF